MVPHSGWRAGLAGAGVGALYGALLFGFAVGAAGGGHGTYIPFAVFGAPLSLLPIPWGLAGFLMWPLAGAGISCARGRPWPAFVLLLQAAGAAATLLYGNPAESVDQQWTYFARVYATDAPWLI